MYMEKVITLDNISILKNAFSQYRSAVIFGKGPTFKNIPKTDDNVLHIGINQAANYLNECDMLVMNDIESIFNVHDDVYSKVKCIIIPEYPHKNRRLYLDTTWKILLDKIGCTFNGHIVVYNLKTNPNPNPKLITLNTAITSSNTANEFVCSYLSNIKNIDLYGIGILGRCDYHDVFENPCNNSYNDGSINLIRNNIVQICDLYDVNYNFN